MDLKCMWLAFKSDTFYFEWTITSSKNEWIFLKSQQNWTKTFVVRKNLKFLSKYVETNLQNEVK